jgi:sugar phosphate isomerase/epimerase
LKLAFSTLGCPEWTLEQVAAAARNLGYHGTELRALGGSINLLQRSEFQPGSIERTGAFFRDQNLAICCVDTSCCFDSADAGTRQENIEIALRHCEIAAALDAPLIRVFPNEIPAGATREETRDRIVASLRHVAMRAPSGVRIGLETHGDFARGYAAAEIISLADHPNVGLIWDVANALAAGDSIEESARAVAPYLVHVHLRDAHAVEGREHWLPVLAGRGAVSFAETIDALHGLAYQGYISFEWEKYWHPAIEEPEVAFADFATAMKLALRCESGKESQELQVWG